MVAKSVNTNMIEAALVALGERNGSTVKSIFNYLLRTKKVRPSSRAKVALAIRRALKSGVLTKKSANTFVVQVAAKQPSRASAKNRKTRRMRKKSVEKTNKRRRRQRKRKSLKKKSRRSSKKSKRAARKSQKKRRTKVNRKRKSQVKAVQRKRYSPYPLRKAARGIRYTA